MSGLVSGFSERHGRVTAQHHRQVESAENSGTWDQASGRTPCTHALGKGYRETDAVKTRAQGEDDLEDWGTKACPCMPKNAFFFTPHPKTP